tara:strand:+ start:165 stop:485 length:321 start_codon:yes stop_codon:yes gene_type:complete
MVKSNEIIEMQEQKIKERKECKEKKVKKGGLMGGGLNPTRNKRAYSKKWNKQWKQLKINLYLNKKKIEAQEDEEEKHHLLNRQELILTVMRTFSDYQFTSTGRKYK